MIYDRLLRLTDYIAGLGLVASIVEFGRLGQLMRDMVLE